MGKDTRLLHSQRAPRGHDEIARRRKFRSVAESPCPYARPTGSEYQVTGVTKRERIPLDASAPRETPLRPRLVLVPLASLDPVFLREPVASGPNLNPSLKLPPVLPMTKPRPERGVGKGKVVGDGPLARRNEPTPSTFNGLRGIGPGFAPNGLKEDVKPKGGVLPRPRPPNAYVVRLGGAWIPRNSHQVVVRNLRMTFPVASQYRAEIPRPAS